MGIRKATFFHSLPHSVNPSKKALCSACVHLPDDCPFCLACCDEDFEVQEEPVDPLRLRLFPTPVGVIGFFFWRKADAEAVEADPGLARGGAEGHMIADGSLFTPVAFVLLGFGSNSSAVGFGSIGLKDLKGESVAGFKRGADVYTSSLGFKTASESCVSEFSVLVVLVFELGWDGGGSSLFWEDCFDGFISISDGWMDGKGDDLPSCPTSFIFLLEGGPSL